MSKMHTLFTFWLGNKPDECYNLDVEDLIKKFLQWLHTKDQDWLEYYGKEVAVRHFISAGLKSTFKESEYTSIMHYLEPVYMKFTYPPKLD